MSVKYFHITHEEKLLLEKHWNYHSEGFDAPLTEHDFKVIDFALGMLRPLNQDPRPEKTSLEKQRVCLLIAKKMVETGCTKKAALDQLYGDGVNGLRYAFKNRVMSAETLNNYANRDPDVRPENYLNEDGFFPPAVTIHSELIIGSSLQN